MEAHSSVIILTITMLEVPLRRAQSLVTSGGLVALGNYLQGYSIYGQKWIKDFSKKATR